MEAIERIVHRATSAAAVVGLQSAITAIEKLQAGPIPHSLTARQWPAYHQGLVDAKAEIEKLIVATNDRS